MRDKLKKISKLLLGIKLSQNGCWVWEGSKDKKGYGRFRINNKKILLHRLMYEIVYGELPENKIIMHICDNPPCINPNHLKAGTRKENNQDAVDKGRINLSERGRNKGIQVKQFTHEDHFVCEYRSVKEASRKTNIRSVAIYNVVAGRAKTAGGFIWKK